MILPTYLLHAAENFQPGRTLNLIVLAAASAGFILLLWAIPFFRPIIEAIKNLLIVVLHEIGVRSKIKTILKLKMSGWSGQTASRKKVDVSPAPLQPEVETNEPANIPKAPVPEEPAVQAKKAVNPGKEQKLLGYSANNQGIEFLAKKNGKPAPRAKPQRPKNKKKGVRPGKQKSPSKGKGPPQSSK